MKIIFNSLNSGLGNNGGSRTVLKCAESIRSLGHECDILDSVDNFTWFDHKPIIRTLPRDVDAIVSTACTTILGTYNLVVPKKAWYIRAHEVWSMPEEVLESYYQYKGILNIVNSNGLKTMLKEDFDSESVIARQGIDFDWWEDKKLRPKNKIRIGCLSHKNPSKRWQDFVKLAEILGTDDYEYICIGVLEPKNCDFLTDVRLNVKAEELKDVYSSCHIWFSPTENEGLHNVPMEAALCGCLLVCNDNKRNGMVLDYAFDNETAMVYEARNIEKAAEIIKSPNWSLVSNMQDCLRTEIGTRKENMKKFVSYLEEL